MLDFVTHRRHWVVSCGLTDNDADKNLLGHLRLSVKQDSPETLIVRLCKWLELGWTLEDDLFELLGHNERLCRVHFDVVRLLHEGDTLGKVSSVEADADRGLRVPKLINTVPRRAIHTAYRELDFVSIAIKPVSVDDFWAQRHFFAPGVPRWCNLAVLLDLVVQHLSELGEHSLKVGMLFLELLGVRVLRKRSYSFLYRLGKDCINVCLGDTRLLLELAL